MKEEKKELEEKLAKMHQEREKLNEERERVSQERLALAKDNEESTAAALRLDEIERDQKSVQEKLAAVERLKADSEKTRKELEEERTKVAKEREIDLEKLQEENQRTRREREDLESERKKLIEEKKELEATRAKLADEHAIRAEVNRDRKSQVKAAEVAVREAFGEKELEWGNERDELRRKAEEEQVKSQKADAELKNLRDKLVKAGYCHQEEIEALQKELAQAKADAEKANHANVDVSESQNAQRARVNELEYKVEADKVCFEQEKSRLLGELAKLEVFIALFSARCLFMLG